MGGVNGLSGSRTAAESLSAANKLPKPALDSAAVSAMAETSYGRLLDSRQLYSNLAMCELNNQYTLSLRSLLQFGSILGST